MHLGFATRQNSLGFRALGAGSFVARLGVASALCVAPTFGQASTHALRFFGTGANQQDRARIPIDDDQAGPDASAVCDVGADAFSIEFWIRGTLAANPTSASGGDQSFPDERWRDGNIVLDRGIVGGSQRTFGVSVAGGFVRFGTGRGDGPNADATPNTIEGNQTVLDGAWHHVALVRYGQNGRKVIYVDGQLDFASATGASTADISYPDDGVPSSGSIWNPYLGIGGDKFDTTPGQHAFHGEIDELRVWHSNRTQSSINSDMHRVLAPDTPLLLADYRFEEGSGTALHSACNSPAPVGELVQGVAGNGEWTAYATNPNDTAPVFNGALPPGFERSLVASGLIEPTGLVCAPDGRIFVAQRGGAILAARTTTTSVTTLLQLNVNLEFGERGLDGIALDPRFPQNGFVYVFYTTTEPRDRVSRFTVQGDTIAASSEVVLWQHPATSSQIHHGGALAFGLDGKLYIAVGDQDNSANAPLLSTPSGKILRLNKDGSIPSDNPFLATPGALPEIWARGLRNPFRMTFDPTRGTLWIGDVGGNGDTSWEEIERGVAGADYGWPTQEGPVCYSGNCATITPATYQYRHDDPAFAVGLHGGSVIAGAVYRGTQFPAEYRGNLFIADYANRWIRRLVFDAAGHVIADPVFLPGPEAGPVVGLSVGSDGALYYVAYGVPWLPPAEASRLYRIAYTGSANQAPLAVASASKTNGLPPLRVQFKGSASSDPDQGPGALTYHWDFGDGAMSSEADPAHTYASAGVYDAVLIVSDGASSTQAVAVRITCGNAPVGVITSPIDGSQYVAGQTITFAATATDVEDGALPDRAFSWQVLLMHSAHTHPFFGPVNSGHTGTFTIPVSGHGPSDTHYDVILRVHDSNGLEHVSTVSIYPTPTPVTFETTPTAIPLTIDGQPETTPLSISSLVGFQHVAVAPPTYVMGTQTLVFWRWTNGATTNTTTWTAPAGGGALRAIYRLRP